MEIGIIALLNQISICSRSGLCVVFRSKVDFMTCGCHWSVWFSTGLVDSRLITTGTEHNAVITAGKGILQYVYVRLLQHTGLELDLSDSSKKKIDRFGFIVQFQILVTDIFQTLENTSRLSWLITVLAALMWYLWVVVAPTCIYCTFFRAMALMHIDVASYAIAMMEALKAQLYIQFVHSLDITLPQCMGIIFSQSKEEHGCCGTWITTLGNNKTKENINCQHHRITNKTVRQLSLNKRSAHTSSKPERQSWTD